MNHHLLHGKFSTISGKADELESILVQAADLMKTAKGCQLYVVSRDEKNENDVWLTEIWNSKEDHANSLSVSGVRELIGQALPLFAEPPKSGQALILKGGSIK